MKKVLILVVAIFLSNSTIIGSSGEDVCGTTGVSSGKYLPTSGNIKILVIFAQFKDDPNTDTTGWTKDTYPSWANTFINETPNGNYPWYNLSHYFNERSTEK